MVDVIIPPTMGAAMGFITSEQRSNRQGHRLLPDQPPTDALCRFPQTGIVCWIGRYRSRLQNDYWTTAQALGDALDRPGCQCHHRITMLPDEPPLGGILGESLSQELLTPTNLPHTFLLFPGQPSGNL